MATNASLRMTLQRTLWLADSAENHLRALGASEVADAVSNCVYATQLAMQQIGAEHGDSAEALTMKLSNAPRQDDSQPSEKEG